MTTQTQQQLEESLQTLRDADLFQIARNQSAEHRLLAISMLVKRSSPYAQHPEILSESGALIKDDPRILRQTDPASAVALQKLPGIFEVIYDDVCARKDLERATSERHANLAQQVSENHERHSEAYEQLTRALAEQADKHAKDVRALTEIFVAAVKAETEARTFELAGQATAHNAEVAHLKRRIALLERSLYRKIADYVTSVVARVYGKFVRKTDNTTL